MAGLKQRGENITQQTNGSARGFLPSCRSHCEAALHYSGASVVLFPHSIHVGKNPYGLQFEHQPPARFRR